MDSIPQLKAPDRSLTRITRICTNPKRNRGNGDEESGVLRSGTEANKGNEGQNRVINSSVPHRQLEQMAQSISELASNCSRCMAATIWQARPGRCSAAMGYTRPARFKEELRRLQSCRTGRQS